MSIRPAGLEKVWVWKSSRLWVIKNKNGEWASASVYKVSRWWRHTGCEWEAIWLKANYKLFEGRFKGKIFGFAQVDIEVPDELYDKFSEMAPLFVVQEIPDYNISEKEKTDRKTDEETQKCLAVMKSKNIFLYTPMIYWYLQHGSKFTAVHQLVEYKQSNPFHGFQKKWQMSGVIWIRIPWKNSGVTLQN